MAGVPGPKFPYWEVWEAPVWEVQSDGRDADPTLQKLPMVETELWGQQPSLKEEDKHTEMDPQRLTQ